MSVKADKVNITAEVAGRKIILEQIILELHTATAYGNHIRHV